MTFIGAFTAFFAATVGLVQNDIKRVIAYSTCSQLGYMFVALGTGFYGAAIFHLFTHAFFKALLFLGSGSVIHAVSDEQDMRRMGGLRKHIPTTYWMMVIGTLALTGVGIPATIIGTAGFFSKDAIIEGAFVAHNAVAGFAFIALVVAAMFTSFYSWRLIFMTFHGEPRASHDVMHHVHESPPVMLVPLFILAAGALFAGVVFHDAFIGETYAEFWKASLFTLPDNHILHDFHDVPLWVKLAPFVAMIVGFLRRLPVLHPLAADAEGPGRPAPRAVRLPAQQVVFRRTLRLPVRAVPPSGSARFLWKQGDGWFIDGFGPDGVSARVRRSDQPRRQAADRLSLSLRLRDADRHRGPRHLDDARELFLMTDWPILSTVTFLPLVGAFLILLIREELEAAKRNIRNDRAADHDRDLPDLAADLDRTSTMPRPASRWSEKVDWLDSGISYHMGVDGISMLFVILTTFLMPLCILASWESVEKRVKDYMIAFLLLETLMIGVFCALDIVLFYVFFEAGLIPMFIIIGVWGGKRRVYASFKFFLYTLLGSVLMLLAIMAMFFAVGHHRHPDAA